MDRGQEIRELKLGATFTNPNARTVYHTIKYDFKPASVDVHKEATLETGSNNSVTVTVPHLDGSGVPNTIFKGNQRDYTKKECVLIFNRETNEIILEKLSSNIQVKKTRTDSSNKQASQQQQPPLPAINTAKLENQTARHSSKTRVSTGIRKNVLNYVPKHSPLQGSPSYPHKSPQQAPAWNANNNTSTLPSITSLLDDNNFANQQQQQPPPPSSVYNNSKNSNSNNNLSSSSSSMLPKSSANAMSSQQQQQQLQQQQQSQPHQMADDIGVLSSSESSSDSNDDSDSDSDDSVDSDMDNPPPPPQHHHSMNNINPNNLSMANQIHNSNSNHKKVPTTSMSNHMDNSSKAALLTKDLCLSDSNSDSDY